jgi:hypothetical protein
VNSLSEDHFKLDRTDKYQVARHTSPNAASKFVSI